MKILNWLGAAALVLVGLFFTSRARTHKLRAERLTNKELQAQASKKQGALKKATKLGEKASASMQKSKDALAKSKLRQKKLEERNETSLADRVRIFNDGL